jgi:hypothetical protein
MESPFTKLTLDGFLAMCGHVPLQRVVPFEGFAAQIAYKGSFFRMCASYVALQLALFTKVGRALFALKHFLHWVVSRNMRLYFVHSSYSYCGKASSAEGTENFLSTFPMRRLWTRTC